MAGGGGKAGWVEEGSFVACRTTIGLRPARGWTAPDAMHRNASAGPADLDLPSAIARMRRPWPPPTPPSRVRSWKVKTTYPNGTSEDVKFLGMPKDSDWVLYGGDESDLTLGMRNWLAYYLARATGEYATRCVRACVCRCGGGKGGMH